MVLQPLFYFFYLHLLSSNHPLISNSNNKITFSNYIFTKDIYKINKAWDELEVGGVVIGDVPSWRVDNMPYGGVKDSGVGREGIRFAMEDMTELRLLVIRDKNR